MDHFNYRHGRLYAEEVPVLDIAQAVGTPCYIYSAQTLTHHWRVFQEAFKHRPHKICYSVKANSNLAVLNLFAQLGSGFDVVSQGELIRVIEAQGDPKEVVFSGVGKKPEEMAFALEQGIFCFNVESESELETLNQIAAHVNKKAPVAFRINPNIDPQSHPYIATGLKENKFGIPCDKALEIYLKAKRLPHINVIGLDYHIGSQLVALSPFIEALKRMKELMACLSEEGIQIKHLDIGGGLGVVYQNETPPLPKAYADAISEQCPDPNLMIILEPGRAIAANAGILVTQVITLKENAGKHFCIVDAGMNDFLRPALYQAWQNIIPVIEGNGLSGDSQCYDIVGPICESSDFLAKDRQLCVAPKDYLALRTAGAYGYVMSSNYNTRLKPAEVMVKGDLYQIVGKRQSYAQLLEGESIWVA